MYASGSSPNTRIPIRETLDKRVAHGRVEVALAAPLAATIVQDALAQVRGVRFARRGRQWQATFGERSGLLVYALSVRVEALDDATSAIECELTQSASLSRQTTYAWLIASLVGIPAALLWRHRSERTERRLVERVIPGVLEAVTREEARHLGYR